MSIHFEEALPSPGKPVKEVEIHPEAPAIVGSWSCPSDLKNDVSRIGAKAVGLLRLPEPWVPKFTVLTTAFWKSFQEMGDALSVIQKLPADEQGLLRRFLEAARANGGLLGHIMVRSNGTAEGLLRRGAHTSYMVNASLKAVAEAADLILKSAGDEVMCIILQAAIEPGLPGHMSNERRLSSSKKRWLIEGLPRAEDSRQQFVDASAAAPSDVLLASTERELVACLRGVAGALVRIGGGRFHCEWVWSGKCLWILQSDEEELQQPSKVTEQWLRARDPAPEPLLPQSQIVHFRDLHSKEWKKLQRPQQFQSLGFPVADVYILTGDGWTNRSPSEAAAQEKDLKAMCKRPVVVRFDISTRVQQDDTFLPTSPAMSNPAELLAYMEKQAKDFQRRGIKASDWAFLIANLVPAKASAMVQARPKGQMVKIDTLWGYPDGLLHFPHDTWFWYADGRVREHRRYKNLCLLPGPDSWVRCDIGPPFDWQPVLSKEEIATLAGWGLKLAEALDAEVQLMALARIGGGRGPAACLPWHYTSGEVPQYSESLLALPDQKQLEIIRSREDLESLAGITPQRRLSGYLIKPQDSLLRDDGFLESCARHAAAQHKPIYFEGSLLGHAYYVMARTGAVVIPITGQEPKGDRKKYHKLVRDRIPVIIRKAGGLARVRHMPTSEAHALLAQKLIEEAFEVRSSEASDLIEELADVLEVVEALRSHSGIETTTLARLQEEKRAKRGGFDSLIYLEETDLQSLRAERDSGGRLPLFSEEGHSVPGKQQPVDKRVQVRTAKSPEEILRFTLSLIPPAGRTFGAASFEVRQGDLRIEVRYQQAEALVSVTRTTSRESPGQLTLFPELISKSQNHEHAQ